MANFSAVCYLFVFQGERGYNLDTLQYGLLFTASEVKYFLINLEDFNLKIHSVVPRLILISKI